MQVVHGVLERVDHTVLAVTSWLLPVHQLAISATVEYACALTAALQVLWSEWKATAITLSNLAVTASNWLKDTIYTSTPHPSLQLIEQETSLQPELPKGIGQLIGTDRSVISVGFRRRAGRRATG